MTNTNQTRSTLDGSERRESEDVLEAKLDEKQPIKRKLWEPRELQKRNLYFFLLCVLASIVALIILFIVSEKCNGLSGVDGNYYYVWTYGPTALLTLATAHWSAVEYRAKQVIPWLQMQKRRKSPQDSVLLDYVSP